MKSVNTLKNESSHDFDSLVSLLAVLRSDNGCPWDKAQTHESIRKCLIEETYEVVDAIDKDNATSLREELGDLLFQVLFHSQIEDEKGNFNIDEVINEVCNKMIYRHPHVFGDRKADIDQVPINWDELKKKEKNYASVSETFKNVPDSLPALLKCQKIVNKAKSKIGVNDTDISGFISNFDNLKVSENAKRIFEICSLSDANTCDLEYELNIITNQFICECERIENAKI